MNRLALASEAVVIGGFSEGSNLMDPLRVALSEGKNKMFASVAEDSPNVADIQTDPASYIKLFEGKTIVMHSLASIIMAERYAGLREKAKGFVLLNPVEGPGLLGTLKGAIGVALQKENNEEDPKYVPSFSQGPKELIRHPIVNLRNPLFASRLSTAGSILETTTPYEDGVGYFEYADDEFGFQNVGPNLQNIKEKGYDGARLSGKHMAPVYRPEDTTRQLVEYMNATQ
ncbi:MAG: hypothetical protein ACI9T8_000099 [Candidatus Saccharimonadales bacterium]|jgi:hypothetical protein